MLGWCDKCNAVVTDGLCPKHGITRPLSHVNSVDIHPLSPFEKAFFNERMNGTRFGEGTFLIYSDRNYRRKVVTLDYPLAEVQLVKNEVVVTPLIRGEIRGMDTQSLVDINQPRIDKLTKVTKAFSAWELEHSKNAIISFSGGKDSVVLVDLLSDFHLNKVFIDTRLEFPETHEFIRSRSRSNGSRLDIARAESSFFSLCEEKGFPKHGYRWCCKTQKFAPFTKYLNDNFGDEQVSVFSGERRWEGMYRMTQPLRKAHKHILNQQTIQPMLDWFAMDIWCYIWSKNLPINRVYDYFDRCGCWLCPFGLEYRIYLLQFTHPNLYSSLVKIGGVSSRAAPKKEKSDKGERKPCMMELDGKMINTCDVYGHFFVNGICFRCGQEGPSTIEVTPKSSSHSSNVCTEATV